MIRIKTALTKVPAKPRARRAETTESPRLNQPTSESEKWGIKR